MATWKSSFRMVLVPSIFMNFRSWHDWRPWTHHLGSSLITLNNISFTHIHLSGCNDIRSDCESKLIPTRGCDSYVRYRCGKSCKLCNGKCEYRYYISHCISRVNLCNYVLVFSIFSSISKELDVICRSDSDCPSDKRNCIDKICTGNKEYWEYRVTKYLIL